jgi:hypothetical protein
MRSTILAQIHIGHRVVVSCVHLSWNCYFQYISIGSILLCFVTFAIEFDVT